MRRIAGLVVETIEAGHYVTITPDPSGARVSFHVWKNDAGFAGRAWELRRTRSGTKYPTVALGDGFSTMKAAFAYAAAQMNSEFAFALKIDAILAAEARAIADEVIEQKLRSIEILKAEIEALRPTTPICEFPEPVDQAAWSAAFDNGRLAGDRMTERELEQCECIPYGQGEWSSDHQAACPAKRESQR